MQKLYSDVTLTAAAAYKILCLWLLWVHSRKRDKKKDRKMHYYVEKAV